MSHRLSAPVPPPPRGPALAVSLTGALLVVAVVAVCHGTFSVPFYFDDVPAIIENPTIRHLRHVGDVFSPPSNGSAVTGRPLVNFSFALNYAVGGIAPAGYHAVSLVLHAAARHPHEAIVEFETTLRLNPSHGLAHFGLGEALVAVSRRPEAVAHFEQAVRLPPNFSPARAALAALRP